MPQVSNERPMAAPLSHRGPSKAPTADSIEINKKKMFGLLHEPQTGKPLVRHVRYLKVGFGLGADTPDVHVHMRHPTEEKPERWVLDVGAYEKDDTGRNRRVVKSWFFATKAEIVEAYKKALEIAPVRKHPVKFPYFTFQRLGVDGNYRPDFDHIELYGPYPTELELVFLTNDPLEYAWQVWSASNLKCEGDGINARRRVDWWQNDHEKKLAEKAQRNGELYFPIIGGCYTGGCPFPRGIEGKNGKPERPCKAHGSLYFQLAKSPRFGVTCSYDTTGKRSITQLFSGIENIKAFTSGVNDPDRGFIAGAPLMLALGSYKTSTPEGQVSTQYSVRLEFRATTNAVDMVRLLNESVYQFREAATVNQRRIAAPVTLLDPAPPADGDAEDEGDASASQQGEDPGPVVSEETITRALNNEFWHQGDGDDQSEEDIPEGEYDPDDGIPLPAEEVATKPAADPAPAPQPQAAQEATRRPLRKDDFSPQAWKTMLLYWKAAGKGNEAKLLAFLGEAKEFGLSPDEMVDHLRRLAEGA